MLKQVFKNAIFAQLQFNYVVIEYCDWKLKSFKCYLIYFIRLVVQTWWRQYLPKIRKGNKSNNTWKTLIFNHSILWQHAHSQLSPKSPQIRNFTCGKLGHCPWTILFKSWIVVDVSLLSADFHFQLRMESLHE